MGANITPERCVSAIFSNFLYVTGRTKALPMIEGMMLADKTTSLDRTGVPTNSVLTLAAGALASTHFQTLLQSGDTSQVPGFSPSTCGGI